MTPVHDATEIEVLFSNCVEKEKHHQYYKHNVSNPITRQEGCC